MAKDHMGKQLAKGDEVIITLDAPVVMGRILDMKGGTISLAGGNTQPPAIAVLIEIIGNPQNMSIPGCFKLHTEKVMTQ